MKNLIAIYNLSLMILCAYACKIDWDSTCQSHSDCCSSICDNNNGQWIYGLCRPSISTKKGETTTKMNAECRSDWYDRCTKNSDCCSNTCENNNGQWDFGVCKPKVTTRKTHTTFKMVPICKKDWDNTCSKNVDCCSNICDRHSDGPWDFGVCAPKTNQKLILTTTTSTSRIIGSSATTKIMETTQQNMVSNKDLPICECICNNNGEKSFGICKADQVITKKNLSDTTIQPKTNCKTDWDNTCKYNNDCCSNICENYNGKWNLGVCRPKVK